MTRLNPPETIWKVRGALWVLRVLPEVRRQVREGRIDSILVRPPPHLPTTATAGVLSALHRRPNSCLERALILQAWYVAHGAPQDVIIGATSREDAFRAHAWLDGQEACEGFDEIIRLPPRVP